MLALEVLFFTVVGLFLIAGAAVGVIWVVVGRSCLPWLRRDLQRRDTVLRNQEQEAARLAAEQGTKALSLYNLETRNLAIARWKEAGGHPPLQGDARIPFTSSSVTP